MKILIDMNLSPTWVSVLERAGHTAVHWSTIGAPNAPDRVILEWAKTQGHVLFTHDLDIGAILAATNADAPSVIQFRSQDVTPDKAKDFLLNPLKRFENDLLRGTLISLDEEKSRARLLPVR
jgi:predicted nuclease of predicted toxin-antitoxin system